MADKDGGGRTLPLLGAIILPGLCVVAPTLLVGLSITHDGDAGQGWKEMLAILKNVNTQWGVVVSLAGVGFLIGIVARAIKVNAADNICGPMIKWLLGRWPLRWFRDPFAESLYEKEFPYLPMMEWKRRQVQQHADGLILPEPETAHSIINLWKMELIEEAEKAFSLIEDCVARVRLFASLFWAGLCGCLVTVVGMIACGILQERGAAAFQPVLLVQVAVCFLLMVVFGWRIRPVRGQEVAHVLLAYIVLQKKAAKFSTHATPAAEVPNQSDTTIILPSGSLLGTEKIGR